jgi:hypothetical protein
MKRNQKRMWQLIAGVILAEIFSLTGFASFAATWVDGTRIWQIDPTQADWISGAYFVGCGATVPLLVGLSDRLDAR